MQHKLRKSLQRDAYQPLGNPRGVLGGQPKPHRPRTISTEDAHSASKADTMTTDTTPHTDPLAAAVAAMHQLAATDWATMKHTLEAEERPGPVPSTSVLEYAYAGAFLSELGYVGNHESTRLWKIDTTELQAAHRFILGITERHRTALFRLSVDEW